MLNDLNNILKDYQIAVQEESEMCKGYEDSDECDPYCYNAQVRVKELETAVKEEIEELENNGIAWREEISFDIEQIIDNIIENRL